MSERKAIVKIENVQLSPTQRRLIDQPTPPEFLETKPGRGGKQLTYVSGGYVTAKLNAVFGPLNWEFKVTERGQTERKNEKNAEGEVWVYGELSIIDHVKDFRVTKGQYGQHPIHTSVPLGDAYKAASTDALKKCASLFGIALDVYWQALDESGTAALKGKKGAVVSGQVIPKAKVHQADSASPSNGFETAKAMIAIQTDVTTLREGRNKITGSPKYVANEKEALVKAINARIAVLEK